MSDKINPSYYQKGNIQTMDYIEAIGIGQEFCVASIIKYTSRYKDKNGLEDLKKAQWFLTRLISLVEKEPSNQ